MVNETAAGEEGHLVAGDGVSGGDRIEDFGEGRWHYIAERGEGGSYVSVRGGRWAGCHDMVDGEIDIFLPELVVRKILWVVAENGFRHLIFPYEY